jgi:hypothetical protein
MIIRVNCNIKMMVDYLMIIRVNCNIKMMVDLLNCCGNTR